MKLHIRTLYDDVVTGLVRFAAITIILLGALAVGGLGWFVCATAMLAVLYLLW